LAEFKLTSREIVNIGFFILSLALGVETVIYFLAFFTYLPILLGANLIIIIVLFVRHAKKLAIIALCVFIVDILYYLFLILFMISLISCTVNC
jgi:hypothetical protein